MLRRNGVATAEILPTGVEALDEALGGGLPRAALTEIHGLETRDAGAVAGFVLALASLLLAGARRKAACAVDRHVGDFSRGRTALCAGPRTALRHRAGRCAGLRDPQARGRAVGCRGGGAAEGAVGGAARGARQCETSRPDGDAPAAAPGPGSGPSCLPAAPGCHARADRGAGAPGRFAGAGGTARHDGRLACPVDRSAGFHRRNRQEPHGTAGTVRTGMEPR